MGTQLGTMTVESKYMRALIISLAVLVSCTRPNPNRCCTDEADCTAKDIPIGSMCSDGLVCRGNQCIAQPCTSSTQCDAAAPYCIAELCSETCGEDAECPGFGEDPAAAFCVAGQCVACRESADCKASAPVCDAGKCVGCNDNADCASDVCDVDTATCIDEAAVLYVDANGSATSDCTRAARCTIVHAMAIATSARNAIRLGSGGHFMGGMGPVGDLEVTIYGPGTLSADGGASDGATLRVRDAVWNGNTGAANNGVNMPMSTVDLRRVELNGYYHYFEVGNLIVRDSKLRSTMAGGSTLIALSGETAGLGGATANRGSTLVIERSSVEGGDPAITVGFSSSFEISNSVFLNQGSNNGWFSVNGNAANTSSVRFSTFYNGVLKCGTTGTGFFVSTNNIFVNARVGAPPDTATGSRCTHSYDLVRPQTTSLAGPGNLLGAEPKWVNPLSGDFHLESTSAAIDAADPAATEAVDFDGTARPQGAGRDIGAFEFK
jgi:hypothetical protein